MDILSLPDNEPFIAGTDESIDICSNQIMKLSDRPFAIAAEEKPVSKLICKPTS